MIWISIKLNIIYLSDVDSHVFTSFLKLVNSLSKFTIFINALTTAPLRAAWRCYSTAVCHVPVLCQNYSSSHSQCCMVAWALLFLWHQRSWWNSNGVTPTGTRNTDGIEKLAIFDEYIAIFWKWFYYKTGTELLHRANRKWSTKCCHFQWLSDCYLHK